MNGVYDFIQTINDGHWFSTQNKQWSWLNAVYELCIYLFNVAAFSRGYWFNTKHKQLSLLIQRMKGGH